MATSWRKDTLRRQGQKAKAGRWPGFRVCGGAAETVHALDRMQRQV